MDDRRFRHELVTALETAAVKLDDPVMDDLVDSLQRLNDLHVRMHRLLEKRPLIDLDSYERSLAMAAAVTKDVATQLKHRKAGFRRVYGLSTSAMIRRNRHELMETVAGIYAMLLPGGWEDITASNVEGPAIRFVWASTSLFFEETGQKLPSAPTVGRLIRQLKSTHVVKIPEKSELR